VDYVMGVSDSTRLLANLTIRRPVQLALDMGCGCGYHAIRAARHAERAIAVDINPRAIAFTGFNCMVNDVHNVECRLGDMFAAVEGLAFDLIVSNLPFVISPDRSYVYRDSGRGGDQVSREFLQTAPRYLRDGGLASVIFNWAHRPEGDWGAPVRDWIANAGCDLWLLRKASYDPLAYANMWNQRLASEGDVQRYQQTIVRWTSHFAKMGIDAVGYGVALIRRREGEARMRTEDIPEGGADVEAGEELDRLLAVDDALHALNDAELLARTVTVALDSQLEQTLRWREGSFRVAEARLTLNSPLRPSADVDRPLAVLLGQIDGTSTVRTALDRAAQAMGRGDPMDTLAFRDEALPVVRELLSFGFLRLAG